jgi:oligoendopeptidase F
MVSTLPRAVLLAGLLLTAALGSRGVAVADDRTTADPTRAFESWEAWERGYDDLGSAIDAFLALTDGPIESPERLLTVVKARDRVYRTAREVEGYLYLRLQLNGSDEEARSREHLIEKTDLKWYTAGSPWLTSTLTALGREKIDQWLVGNEALRRYDFFFRRFFDGAGHPYPEGEEMFRTLSGLSAQQSSRIYSAVAVTEPPRVEVRLQSGESLHLNPGLARTIHSELPNAMDGRAVDQAWLTALGRQSQTYAALLEGIVKRERLVAEVRNFDSVLSSKLQGDAISPEAIRHVVRVAREASDPLRRYHSIRKAVLGLEEYGLEDRFIPLDPGGREITYSEARSLITASAESLGTEVRDLVERAFSEEWIDAVERPGKRANAGFTSVAGHPFVLIHYRGSLENVFQLAHEIGHAVHAYLAHHAQPFVYTHPSSLTGESVASAFEGVLVTEMVARATDADERVRVLDLSIQNLLRLFHRPMLDADFELRVYDSTGPMTGLSLAALYSKILSEFYGHSVLLNDWDGNAWQLTPHYFTSPLYMGRYGLSSAAGSALVTQLTSSSESDAAVGRQALLDLMRAGSSDYPLELLRQAGVDLGEPGTIQRLVSRLESLVAQLEQAVDGG